MSYQRREFLKLGALGLASTLIPIRTFSNTNHPIPVLNNSLTDLKKALAFASEGKRLKLSGNFIDAEEKYKAAIQLVPDDIRFYDGLKKVLYAQKDKTLEVLNLFFKAQRSNPNSAAFASRLARIYIKVEKGNNEIASTFKSSNGFNSLIEEAQSLLSKAIQLDSKNKDYPVEALKLHEFISLNAFQIDARDNNGIKQKRKKNQNAFKHRINSLSKADIIAELELIDKRKRRKLSQEEQLLREKNILRIKKQLYKRLIIIYIKKGRQNKAIIASKKLYSISNNDANSYKILKKTLQKYKKWDQLVKIAKQRYDENNSYWAALGYIRALNKRYNKSGKNKRDLSKAIAVSKKTLLLPLLATDERIKLLLIQSRLFIQKKKYKNAEKNFNKVQSIIINELVYSADLINHYFTSLSMYNIKTKEYGLAENLLKTSLNRDGANAPSIYQTLQNQKKAEKLGHKKTIILPKI